MRILYVAREHSRFAGRPKSPDAAMLAGFVHNGATVAEWAESDPPPSTKVAKACDFLFYPKLRQVPRWMFSLGLPTVCFFGDWRPIDDPVYQRHAQADVMFCQSDDRDAHWVPAPIWVDDFDPPRPPPRRDEWLWTGQILDSPMFDRDRHTDVAELPLGTPLYGVTEPWISGHDYVDAIVSHRYGLSVSHRNDIMRYSSSRLGYYQAGGVTCAVRWFPGCEELVAPGCFIYRTHYELRRFIADPTPGDPDQIRAFARRTFDTTVMCRRILETVAVAA